MHSVRTGTGAFNSPPRQLCHPRFFDEQLDLAVGAIDYVRGSEN